MDGIDWLVQRRLAQQAEEKQRCRRAMVFSAVAPIAVDRLFNKHYLTGAVSLGTAAWLKHAADRDYRKVHGA